MLPPSGTFLAPLRPSLALIMGRLLVGHPRGAGGFLLLFEFHEEFAVLEFQRENALLKVGNNPVEGVGEVFAIRDAFFQLLMGCVGFSAHETSVTKDARHLERRVFDGLSDNPESRLI